MILRLIGKLMGSGKFAQEHWERFMLPQLERAKAAGISPSRIKELGQRALDEADYMATFPGGLLRDYIDAEIEETS